MYVCMYGCMCKCVSVHAVREFSSVLPYFCVSEKCVVLRRALGAPRCSPVPTRGEGVGASTNHNAFTYYLRLRGNRGGWKGMARGRGG